MALKLRDLIALSGMDHLCIRDGLFFSVYALKRAMPSSVRMRLAQGQKQTLWEVKTAYIVYNDFLFPEGATGRGRRGNRS